MQHSINGRCVGSRPRFRFDSGCCAFRVFVAIVHGITLIKIQSIYQLLMTQESQQWAVMVQRTAVTAYLR